MKEGGTVFVTSSMLPMILDELFYIGYQTII